MFTQTTTTLAANTVAYRTRTNQAHTPILAAANVRLRGERVYRAAGAPESTQFVHNAHTYTIKRVTVYTDQDGDTNHVLKIDAKL